MPTDVNTVQLMMRIEAGQDVSAEELDRLARQLRDEIQESGMASAELARGAPAPVGTKGADPVTLGALALVVLPTAVPPLIEFLKSWAMRGEGRTVKVKAQAGDRALEVEFNPATVSQAELKELVGTLAGMLPKEKARR